MAKVVSMTMNIPGVEIWVNYNANNLRITTVEWTLPQSGVSARVRLWNNGTLFYDRTVGGPASGTENIPGNHAVVAIPVGQLGYPGYTLPSYITWNINIETIGI